MSDRSVVEEMAAAINAMDAGASDAADYWEQMPSDVRECYRLSARAAAKVLARRLREAMERGAPLGHVTALLRELEGGEK